MAGVVYIIQRESDGVVKIGHTTDLAGRLRSHQSSFGKHRLVAAVPGDRDYETFILNHFHAYRINKNSLSADHFVFPDDVIESLLKEPASDFREASMYRLSVRVSNEHHEQIRHMAHYDNISKQEIIRRALDLYFAQSINQQAA